MKISYAGTETNLPRLEKTSASEHFTSGCRKEDMRITAIKKGPKEPTKVMRSRTRLSVWNTNTKWIISRFAVSAGGFPVSAHHPLGVDWIQESNPTRFGEQHVERGDSEPSPVTCSSKT